MLLTTHVYNRQPLLHWDLPERSKFGLNHTRAMINEGIDVAVSFRVGQPSETAAVALVSPSIRSTQHVYGQVHENPVAPGTRLRAD
jgi:hypothetical protein